MEQQQAAAWEAQATKLLDVRAELAQGGEPFVRIMEAAASIEPGGTLVIVAPFEPVPLYSVLAERGFTHHTAQVDSGKWVMQFTRQP